MQKSRSLCVGGISMLPALLEDGRSTELSQSSPLGGIPICNFWRHCLCSFTALFFFFWPNAATSYWFLHLNFVLKWYLILQPMQLQETLLIFASSESRLQQRRDVWDPLSWQCDVLFLRSFRVLELCISSTKQHRQRNNIFDVRTTST